MGGHPSRVNTQPEHIHWANGQYSSWVSVAKPRPPLHTTLQQAMPIRPQNSASQLLHLFLVIFTFFLGHVYVRISFIWSTCIVWYFVWTFFQTVDMHVLLPQNKCLQTCNSPPKLFICRFFVWIILSSAENLLEILLDFSFFFFFVLNFMTCSFLKYSRCQRPLYPKKEIVGLIRFSLL